jgi:hypothetical protein
VGRLETNVQRRIDKAPTARRIYHAIKRATFCGLARIRRVL